MQLCQIPHDTASAAGNMAIDAVMLEFGAQAGQAMWRTYGWDEPACTFGYSQRWHWVQTQMEGFSGALVRRITGGGIVDHRNDLTYALTIPPQHPAYRSPALDLYRHLHQRIAAVLLDHGFQAALAECPGGCGDPASRPGLGVCFEAPEPYDVINPLTRAKLAGAALKRSRAGVLVQGSIDLRSMPGLRPAVFAADLDALLAAWLGCKSTAFTGALPADLLVREVKRFASPEWNRRR